MYPHNRVELFLLLRDRFEHDLEFLLLFERCSWLIKRRIVLRPMPGTLVVNSRHVAEIP